MEISNTKLTPISKALYISYLDLCTPFGHEIFWTRSPLHIPHIVIPEDCVLEAASAIRNEINRAFVVLREIGTGRDLKKFLSVSWFLPSFSCVNPVVTFVFRHTMSWYIVSTLSCLLSCHQVVAVLWVISVIGGWFHALTLFYLCKTSYIPSISSSPCFLSLCCMLKRALQWYSPNTESVWWDTVYLSLFTFPLLYEKHEDQVDAIGEKAMIEIKKQYAVFDAKVLSQIPIAGLKKD